MTDTQTPSPSDAELDALALEISDYDDPVYFRRMARAVLARWGQPQAVEQAIEALRPISQNSTDDPRGQADKAIALLLAAPPQQAVLEPRVSEDQWRVLCEQTWGLLEAQDRSAARQLLLDGFKARGITKGGQHGPA